MGHPIEPKEMSHTALGLRKKYKKFSRDFMHGETFLLIAWFKMFFLTYRILKKNVEMLKKKTRKMSRKNMDEPPTAVNRGSLGNLHPSSKHEVLS